MSNAGGKDKVCEDQYRPLNTKGYIKGAWLYLLGIVVIVLLVGYGFYMNSSLNKKVEDLTGGVSSTVSTSKTRTFEEIHKDIKGLSSQAGDSSRSTGSQTKMEIIKEHFNRGLRYSFSKNYDGAIKEFQEVLKLDPNSAEAYNNIGFAYFDKGDINNAIIQHKKALEINPDFANAYYGLALAYERKNRVKDAITSWDKYIELAPEGTVWVEKAKKRRKRLEDMKGGNE